MFQPCQESERQKATAESEVLEEAHAQDNNSQFNNLLFRLLYAYRMRKARSDFIGRSAELEMLREQLDEKQLLWSLHKSGDIPRNIG